MAPESCRFRTTLIPEPYSLMLFYRALNVARVGLDFRPLSRAAAENHRDDFSAQQAAFHDQCEGAGARILIPMVEADRWNSDFFRSATPREKGSGPFT